MLPRVGYNGRLAAGCNLAQPLMCAADAATRLKWPARGEGRGRGGSAGREGRREGGVPGEALLRLMRGGGKMGLSV